MESPQFRANEMCGTPSAPIEEAHDDSSSSSEAEDNNHWNSVCNFTPALAESSTRASSSINKIVEETMRRVESINNLESLIVVENGVRPAPEDPEPTDRRYGTFFWWKPPTELRRLYRGSLLWNLCTAQIIMMMVRATVGATIAVDFAGGKYGWAYSRASAVILIVEVPIGAYTLVEPFLPFGTLTTAAVISIFLDILMIAIAVFASAYLPKSIWVNTAMTFVTLILLFGYTACIARYENKLRASMYTKPTTVEIAQDAHNIPREEENKEDKNNIPLDVISSGSAAS